ncbi:uncharacterized protein LOC124939830 [Impatiens glandulifera]|uniref:uncharacterized protein LOC124939830 n=1 Tax=Impatiens glandulifera TaxID=253017 RepID=UPI001FB0FA76|nr:uncharacterized protein LOC124939830 [Impatiens glandulifera]
MEKSSSVEQEETAAAAQTSKSEAGTVGGESSESVSKLGESPSGSLEAGRSNQGGQSVVGSVQGTAWGLVIVTASQGGEIRVYQNVGLPRKVGRQTGNLFSS